nr:DNA binding,ATP binding protein [Tanacetum cinerariifolium]
MKATSSSRKRNRKGKVVNKKPNNLLDLHIIHIDDNSDDEGMLDRGRNSKTGKHSNEDDSLYGLVVVKQEHQLQIKGDESRIGLTYKSAKEHVAEIRRTKFSIGREPNPLTEDLHQAVKNLSAELYAKDVHCFMELIQNAEDNEYPKGVNPSLEFVITSKYITNTGAPATLLVFNNEKGFSSNNIDSICSVGSSTKKGLRGHGYIGEKGIGFKSVFLITSQFYIFSNGYQIRFNEKPCAHCNVGYIVPEWVEDDTVLSAIKGVYGSATNLPTTTLVLPLKPEKVIPVKKQLSSLHPEALLFLSKIKRLSVREQNDDPSLNTVSAISISSETNFVTSKSMDADSYLVHLTADDVGNECGYHMWKQRFPVKEANKADTRQEVEEWVITLAFPIGERIPRTSSIPGIYAFLPTDTETHLPFIIQADFLLASSRENILWDNKWNQGILDCVPDAFLNAFTSLVKSIENAPVSSLPNMFWFLPIKPSNLRHQLSRVRRAIQEKLRDQTIIPCESYTGQKMFHRPNEVGRLKPKFWTVLNNARSSNLVMGVSEDVYSELLVFIAENWESFHTININNIPIIKYVGMDRKVNLLKMSLCANILFAERSDHISWMTNWNTEFQWSTRKFFMPKATQEAIESCSNDQKPIKKWLKEELKVNFVSTYEYAEDLGLSLGADHNLLVTYAHFLCNSLERKYLYKDQVQALCSKMPIVDNYGKVVKSRNGVLVPANRSKWVELIGSNLWMQDNFVELGEDYSLNYCGNETRDIVRFLENYVKAYDIPRLSPPNAAVPTMSSPLTQPNTILLLKWLKMLNTTKTSLPEELLVFMLDTSIGPLLQNGSVLVDIPLVDEKFYGDEIRQYKDELRTIGVHFENKEACEFIGSRLMSLSASSKLPKTMFFNAEVYSVSGYYFVNSIKEGKWLKTQRGYIAPTNSVMFTHEWKDASQISYLPFIDQVYYGKEIHSFKNELEQLGVAISFDDKCYQLVSENIKSKYLLNSLSSEAFLLILRCIQKSENSDKLVQAVKDTNCLKTNMGYKCPSKCFLLNPESEWGCLLHVFGSSPVLDERFYGSSIKSMSVEFKKIGVMVDFEDTAKEFVRTFKEKDGRRITRASVYSLLDSVKMLQEKKSVVLAKFLDNLFNYDEKILSFFANVFKVKDHPSVDDYCKLCKVWESSGRKIKNTKCRSFREFVAESWDSETEDTFVKNISKLPVQDPNSDEILLIKKSDPGMSSLSRTKLVDIFTKIGVRTLSESAQKNVCDVDLMKFQQVNPKDGIINKGLFKLILGFLADPKLKFEAERRQEAVSRLLKIQAYKTSEPMMVQYGLKLSSGDMVNVEARLMTRWDKKNSRMFFVRNMEKSCGRKMEYASNFGEVIADGVLGKNEELVPHLSELLRLGHLVDFEEEEVDFLLKIKNLQIFKEDEDYLSSTFLSQ